MPRVDSSGNLHHPFQRRVPRQVGFNALQFRLEFIFLISLYQLFIIFVSRRLPKFLAVDQEVTGDSAFSMFNLSLREEWLNNKRYLLSNLLILG